MKFALAFPTFLLVVFSGFSQQKLNITAINDLDSLQAIARKKICVFIHTEWCRYCAQMKYNTFKNDKVIATLNQNYYFVRFDAEQKEDVEFDGLRYHYKPNGNQTGIHEFATKMTIRGKKTVFPRTVILSEQNKIDTVYNSFLNSEGMLNMLEENLKK